MVLNGILMQSTGTAYGDVNIILSDTEAMPICATLRNMIFMK
jgi:hypothetical protein